MSASEDTRGLGIVDMLRRLHLSVQDAQDHHGVSNEPVVNNVLLDRDGAKTSADLVSGEADVRIHTQCGFTLNTESALLIVSR